MHTFFQKINFTTLFFLKILQRNSKLVILGNLGMSGHTHLKWYSITLMKTWTFICGQKTNFTTDFLYKILQRNSKLVILGSLCMHGYTHTSKNLWYLFAGDKTNSSFTFSLRYCKDIANLFLRYFGHNWLRRLKVILSTCWKL